MEKISKNIKKYQFYLLLLLLTVACNEDIEVETKEFNSFVTYNSAIGYYWGDYFGSGTANFQIWLYSDADEDIGILIDGYATLPSSPANFKLGDGTYSVMDNKRVRTVYPSDEDLGGTYAFNERTNQKIMVTGGSFSVILSGSVYASETIYTSRRYDSRERDKIDVYTIETNFTGKEINSRSATVNEILIKFNGPIKFEDMTLSFVEDMTLSFDDIKQSSYNATGTLTTNKSISWTGGVYPAEDDIGMFYEITNWINWDGPLWLDYINEKLLLDDRNTVGEDGDYDLYFKACYYLPSNPNWFYYLDNYQINYNKYTRAMDFSGFYDGHQVYVGLWGEHYVTGEWIVYTSTLVKNAKLELTPGIKSGYTLSFKNRSVSNRSTHINRVDESEYIEKVKRVGRR